MAKLRNRKICGVATSREDGGHWQWCVWGEKWRHRGGMMLEIWGGIGVWIPVYASSNLYHAVGLSEGLTQPDLIEELCRTEEDRTEEDRTGQAEHAAP